MSDFYRQPIRTAQAFGYDEPQGERKTTEDISADLDLIDRTLEDYLSQFGATAIQAVSSIRTLNVQVGTAYTLVSSDVGKIVELTHTATVAVSVPTGFSTGAEVSLVKIGGPGGMTIAGVGVTINSAVSLTVAQYGRRYIYKRAATQWIAS